MSHDQRPRKYATYGRSRAVRLPNYDYSQDIPVHLTICAECQVEQYPGLSQLICENVEIYCRKLQFRLFGYCLMPDHLHVLLSPGDSGVAIDRWLDLFKSYTTNRYMKMGGRPPLWQESANDHVCREGETAESVLRYIVNNPVRRGLIREWDKWEWTKVFIQL